MHEITCNNWLTKRVSKLEQLGVRQSWIRSDGASSLLLREYRGWHRPWLHRGPFRPHPGLNFVQPHRRIGRRHHDRVHVVRRLRLFPFPNGHRFRQLLHSHLHPWLIIILYFNYYLLIIIKIVSFFYSVGICWTDLPDCGGQFVDCLILHIGHDSVAVDRLGHQGLANVELGHGSPDGLVGCRLLDRSWKRSVTYYIIIRF